MIQTAPAGLIIEPDDQLRTGKHLSWNSEKEGRGLGSAGSPRVFIWHSYFGFHPFRARPYDGVHSKWTRSDGLSDPGYIKIFPKNGI